METKQYWKSRKIIIGVISVVIGLLAYIQGQIEVGGALTIEGLMMVGLRIVTKTSVSK